MSDVDALVLRQMESVAPAPSENGSTPAGCAYCAGLVDQVHQRYSDPSVARDILRDMSLCEGYAVGGVARRLVRGV